jgi:hypothetical protein
MEYIEIDGVPVEVPADVAAGSRDDVQAWYDAQIKAKPAARASRVSSSPSTAAPSAGTE